MYSNDFIDQVYLNQFLLCLTHVFTNGRTKNVIISINEMQHLVPISFREQGYSQVTQDVFQLFNDVSHYLYLRATDCKFNDVPGELLRNITLLNKPYCIYGAGCYVMQTPKFICLQITDFGKQ